MKRDIDFQHLPHAILISGASFEKRWEVVVNCINHLLPGGLKSDHPDLCLLPKDSEVVKIEEVRNAIVHLQQSAHQGGSKIVVLKKTEGMLMGACNALLKILEEPPPSSYLFLMSEYPHLLPSTIRSRCFKISLPFQKSISKKRLQEILETLILLQAQKVSIFEAAEKWQKIPFLEVLDSLYYGSLAYFLHENKEKKLFSWYDLIHQTRQKVLNKQNPNSLLALENIFYQFMLIRGK